MHEYALLALVNQTRADPAREGWADQPPRIPMVWNDDLATAARYHSHDMAENDCYRTDHSSCDGTSWQTRVRRYYDGPLRGENQAPGADLPQSLHAAWMSSDEHRPPIFQASEMGAGLAFGDSFSSRAGFGTEDFGGTNYSLRAIPPIPAAAVLPSYNPAQPQREILMNYYGFDFAATSAVVVVGSQRVPLTLQVGSAQNGTWKASRTFADACTPVHFEVTRKDGLTFRYPETGRFSVSRTGECASTTPPPTSTTPTSTTPTTGPGGGGPAVTIDTPSAGAVSGIVTIRAHAGDPGGRVTKMEVRIDGKNRYVRNAATITRTWNTKPKSVKPGTHTITVTAWDDDGNRTTTSVTVTK